MRLTHLHDLASLQQRILATPLRFLLIPLSWLYTASVQLRNILYTRGVFKARRLPCRVISVGNIVVGGTGKTPAVIVIAEHLQREGMRVAILLRGYKRRVREKVTIVSDGEKVCASPIESGDEADMMAKHLSGVPIIVGKCRYLTGQVALERFKVDVLLLDDGFQHRQLARDVDILTIPATHPFGSPKKLLPAGTLREPPTALRRANLILLTHADTPNISAHAKKVVKGLAPNAPVLESIHQPTHLYPLAISSQQSAISMKPSLPTETEIRDPKAIPTDIKELKGKRVLAVCGIGNPDAFVVTLMRCSVASVELLAFPDHHVYTEADKQRMDTAFQAAAADLIVTTQKDEQKLARFVDNWKLPIVVLAVALVITDGDEMLTDVLLGNSSQPS
jgi:tetraacyldisaccharide-1-P 4'-kinase